jgi:hypothetical protein
MTFRYVYSYSNYAQAFVKCPFQVPFDFRGNFMKQVDKKSAVSITDINISKTSAQEDPSLLFGGGKITIDPQLEEKFFGEPIDAAAENFVAPVKSAATPVTVNLGASSKPMATKAPVRPVKRVERVHSIPTEPVAAVLAQKEATPKTTPAPALARENTPTSEGSKRKPMYIAALGAVAAVFIAAMVINAALEPAVVTPEVVATEVIKAEVATAETVEITPTAPTQEEFLQFVSAASAAETPEVAPQLSKSDELVANMAANTLLTLRTHSEPAPVESAPVETPVAAAPATSGPATVSTLYSLVVTAHSEGHSFEHIDDLLNTAHQRGEVDVPAGLVLADGTVDSKTILSLFIAQ